VTGDDRSEPLGFLLEIQELGFVFMSAARKEDVGEDFLIDLASKLKLKL
jgi:hypothetical protein